MTDLAENEDLGDENLNDGDVIEGEVIDENNDDTPQISEAETKALSLGWKPKDEWEGDADDWTSAKRFNQTRDIIDSNKSLRAEQDRMKFEFDQRIENNNQINKQMYDSKVAELKSKRDAAAADADMVTYNDANKQLDELETPAVKDPVAPNSESYAQAVYNNPVTQQYISENPWIKGDGPKATYGQRVFADYLANNSENGTIEEGLEKVTKMVNKEFPKTNPKRNSNKTLGERSQGNRKTSSRVKLTMADLTREESNIFNSMGKTWKSEADFLVAVADMRKGE